MQRRSKPKTMADILNQRQAMASLLAQNRYHASIQRHIQRRLPGFLKEHCLACVSRDELLIVFTDSPAWATQLRFALPGMLGELRKAFDSRWQRTQIRVLSALDAVPVAQTAAVPGVSVIQQVQDAASCCGSPELRTSLLRLTATWRKSAR